LSSSGSHGIVAKPPDWARVVYAESIRRRQIDSWQITPRVLTDALATGGDEAKRAFAAMMEMGKIDIAKIEAARRG
jgi:hypothetical protein